jgi:hypothetical protein
MFQPLQAFDLLFVIGCWNLCSAMAKPSWGDLRKSIAVYGTATAMGICHLHNMRRNILYLPVDSIESTSRMSRTQQFKRHRGVLPKSSDDSFMLPLPPNFDNLGYELGWHSIKYSQLTKFKAEQVPFLVHAHYVWQFTTEVTNAA